MWPLMFQSPRAAPSDPFCVRVFCRALPCCPILPQTRRAETCGLYALGNGALSLSGRKFRPPSGHIPSPRRYMHDLLARWVRGLR